MTGRLVIEMEPAADQAAPAPVPNGLTAPMRCAYTDCHGPLVLVTTSVSTGSRTCAVVRCEDCGAEFLIVVTMALRGDVKPGGQQRRSPAQRHQLAAARSNLARKRATGAA